MLHASARLDAGLELTDLEQRLVNALRALMPEEEICEFGRVSREKTALDTAPELFPDSLAARPLEQGYSLADLATDLPRVTEEVLAQPNVSVVDLDHLAEGASLDTPEFIEAMAAYDGGITVVTASEELATAAATPLQARIDLHAFTSNKGSNEVGADEIYWGISAGNGHGVKNAFKTRTYGSIYTGTYQPIDAGTVLFNGSVEGGLACHIECWEEDHSSSQWYDELLRTLRNVASYLADLVDWMDQVGSPSDQWDKTKEWAALAALIINALARLLEIFRNHDDLVQKRDIAFDRAALTRLANRPAAIDSWVFDGGKEGRFTLDLKWAGTKPSNAINVLTHKTASGWSAPVNAWPGSASSDAPVMATLGDTLYCAVRGGNRIYTSRLTAGRWEPFRQVPHLITGHAPALTAFNGRLYLAYTGSYNDALLLSSANGIDWAPQIQLPGYATTAPALGVRDGILHYARGYGASIVYDWSPDARTWKNLGTAPAAMTFHAPALATHQGKLYLAHRDLMTGKIYVAANTSSGWQNRVNLPGSTPDAPALGVRGDTLYCAVRGGDDKLWLSGLTSAGTWNTFQHIPGTTVTFSAPGIAGYNNDLYVTYRSGTL
ncbi:hypothetical protein ACIBL5_37860 [Streptomyces sp. NPDC050516]|uniref:hypothetical protein n=1 Tax=Streptomyces sp. NPDC050516 TaxID=3365621 RepID=UPI0037A9B8B8